MPTRLFDHDASAVACTTLDSLATVATPLPAALPLLAAGLGGLGLAARRRRRHSSM